METTSTGLSEGQKRREAFQQNLPQIRAYYISQLKDSGIDPNVVFGVTSTEKGIERFDKSWLFVDHVHEDNNDPRNISLSFNDREDMQAFAQAFPNTFGTEAFDADQRSGTSGLVFRRKWQNIF